MIHNPLTLLFAQILSIIAVSLLFSLAVMKVRQPRVIAEIMAGIFLGPSLVGWLAPSLSQAIFPSESMPSLQLLSQFSLVIFMFCVGLHLNIEQLNGNKKRSSVISIAGIVFPFVSALPTAWYLHRYHDLAPAGVTFTSFYLFFAVCLSITAFPVLVRILTDLKETNSQLGVISITAAAFDDAIGWCGVSLVISVVNNQGNPWGAILTFVLTLSLIAGMAFVVRPLMHRLLKLTDHYQWLRENSAAFLLGLAILSAWLTELIGIHALFGAFAFGMTIPREHAEELENKLKVLISSVLLPLFFAYTGLRTQVGFLLTPEALLLTALITIVACCGKFGGCTLAARWSGLSWPDAAAVGSLMNSRGLMELVVLNIGLDLGVISDGLFTMMVAMTLITTFMASPLFGYLKNRKTYSENSFLDNREPLIAGTRDNSLCPVYEIELD
jgi:Kef-type K+ transport system membrane component KefB